MARFCLVAIKQCPYCNDPLHWIKRSDAKYCSPRRRKAASVALSGWELVVALALMTVLILGTVWLTGSVKEAIMVTVPLLIGFRAITVRRL